jgi:hypothetical protein
MLHEEPTKKREQISLVCIDELVPQNHLLRKIDRVIDCSCVYVSLCLCGFFPSEHMLYGNHVGPESDEDDQENTDHHVLQR